MPDESSNEVDLVDDQASHGVAKEICGETVLELIQDKPITKFEEDAFAKSRRRPRLSGRKLPFYSSFSSQSSHGS